MRIRGRIPLVVINAVQNARQRSSAVLQNSFQARPKRGALNFLGIPRTDGVDRIGKHQSCLEQVQAAEEFHLPPVEILPIQSGKQHVPVPEGSLISHVVNGQQSRDIFKAGLVAVQKLLIRRDQPRLPVVYVQHVDRQFQQANRFHHGPAKENVAFAIIAIVLAVRAVDMVAIEILRLLDEIDRHLAVREMPSQQPPGDSFLTDRNVERKLGLLDWQARAKNLPVGGQDQRDFMPEPGQFHRQGAADIRQAAGFGERHRFAGRQQNLHAGGSLMNTRKRGWLEGLCGSLKVLPARNL